MSQCQKCLDTFGPNAFTPQKFQVDYLLTSAQTCFNSNSSVFFEVPFFIIQPKHSHLKTWPLIAISICLNCLASIGSDTQCFSRYLTGCFCLLPFKFLILVNNLLISAFKNLLLPLFPLSEYYLPFVLSYFHLPMTQCSSHLVTLVYLVERVQLS